MESFDFKQGLQSNKLLGQRCSMVKWIIILCLIARAAQANWFEQWGCGMPTASAVAWTPSQLLANMVFWLDASDSSTITLTNNYLLSWADKSMNGHNATQSNYSIKPLYNPTNFNGKGTFYFQSAQIASLAFPATAGTNDWTIVVCYDQLNNASYRYLFTANNNLVLSHCDDDSNVRGPSYYSSSQWHPSAPADRPFSAAGKQVITYVLKSSPANTSEIHKNGSTIFTNLQYVKTEMFTNVQIGYASYGPYANIAEIICIKEAQSSVIVSKLEGYLHWKWGIQLNLATNHPYYGAAP